MSTYMQVDSGGGEGREEVWKERGERGKRMGGD